MKKMKRRHTVQYDDNKEDYRIALYIFAKVTRLQAVAA
jgi:hypothetical protein